MAHREFTVRLSSEIAAKLAAGDDVTTFVGDAIRHQVRREAILAYLTDCEEAGHAQVTEDDIAQFRDTVGGDVTRYHWIYDTPALVSHAAGTSSGVRAGLQLIVDEPDLRIRVPMSCLLEAYAQVPKEGRHLLDWLAINPGVDVAPLDPDPRTAVTVGALATETGRAGAAHAAYIAIEGQGPSLVFTDTTMPAEVLARPA